MKLLWLTLAICLVFWSCGPVTRQAKGALTLWTPRPDSDLFELGLKTPDLKLSEAPRSKAWSDLLAGSDGKPDLIVADGGGDLAEAQRKGVLADLTAAAATLQSQRLWWPGLEGVVKAKPLVFLPSSVMVWGFFYNPSVLKQAGLEVPHDWDSWESAAAELKAKGLTPVALGASFGWPALAWVSVLDMRFSGPQAHRALLDGARSLGDPGMLKVFETLAQWKAQGWFDAGAGTKNWPEALAEVSSGRAGFTLLGTFGITRITDSQTLAFLPLFQGPDKGAPQGQLASLQGFVISASSANPDSALALADAYIASGSPGQVSEGFRSPAAATTGGSGIVQRQNQLLSQAKYILPLLDRVLAPDHARQADQWIQQFFTAGSKQSAADMALAFGNLKP